MKHQPYSKEKLISLYKDLAQRIGSQPTRKQWNEDVMTPSDMPVRQNFGTWNDFVVSCGFNPYKPYLSDLAVKNKVLAKKGKRSSHWKGGKHTDRHGYVQVWNPEHPNARMGGYIHEHRLVMSDILGRPLKSFENVHHRNGKRDDNRPENLELWASIQPSGQRVSDLITFAREILNIYENPELLKGTTHVKQ